VNGKKVSLLLSVSPCAAEGEYIGIFYRQTDAVARARAEAKLVKKENELLESELGRLMLQVGLKKRLASGDFPRHPTKRVQITRKR